jgi:excisionase family DNA binding protein
VSEPLNWLTIEQAAAVSGYHPNYIRRLAKRGVFIGVKVGQLWLIEPERLRAYVAQMERDGDPRTGPRRRRN